jgi:hypothetical protein
VGEGLGVRGKYALFKVHRPLVSPCVYREQ